MTVGLNEDTLGGTLKASLAQYLALEISKGMASWRCLRVKLTIGTYKCSSKKVLYFQLLRIIDILGNGRDSRSVNRYLPWLYNVPANVAAQGPREFLDCVAHIRLMSW